MQPQNLENSAEDAEDARRTIHDIAAAIISVRALAETLSEHVPTLVAMSRSRYPTRHAPIAPATLDALASIPAEIVELCEIARGALQGLGNGTASSRRGERGSDRGAPPAATGWAGSPPARQGQEGAEILLVEDEETVRYVIGQTLQSRGCRVTSASDGEEALRILEARDFDLVLMDLRIPGMSGWETAEKLRLREAPLGRRTRIVGLTASPLLEDRERAREAGMDDVLVKPIDDMALQNVLSRYT